MARTFLIRRLATEGLVGCVSLLWRRWRCIHSVPFAACHTRSSARNAPLQSWPLALIGKCLAEHLRRQLACRLVQRQSCLLDRWPRNRWFLPHGRNTPVWSVAEYHIYRGLAVRWHHVCRVDGGRQSYGRRVLALWGVDPLAIEKSLRLRRLFCVDGLMPSHLVPCCPRGVRRRGSRPGPRVRLRRRFWVFRTYVLLVLVRVPLAVHEWPWASVLP